MTLFQSKVKFSSCLTRHSCEVPSIRAWLTLHSRGLKLNRIQSRCQRLGGIHTWKSVGPSEVGLWSVAFFNLWKSKPFWGTQGTMSRGSYKWVVQMLGSIYQDKSHQERSAVWLFSIKMKIILRHYPCLSEKVPLNGKILKTFCKWKYLWQNSQQRLIWRWIHDVDHPEFIVDLRHWSQF